MYSSRSQLSLLGANHHWLPSKTTVRVTRPDGLVISECPCVPVTDFWFEGSSFFSRTIASNIVRCRSGYTTRIILIWTEFSLTSVGNITLAHRELANFWTKLQTWVCNSCWSQPKLWAYQKGMSPSFCGFLSSPASLMDPGLSSTIILIIKK